MVSARFFDRRRIRLDQMQRDAFGRARPDAGQFAQGGDERGDGIGKH